jgi:hypothetical protein
MPFGYCGTRTMLVPTRRERFFAPRFAVFLLPAFFFVPTFFLAAFFFPAFLELFFLRVAMVSPR